MANSTNTYDLILQNCASKKEWVISGLTNSSTTGHYYSFEDFEMPDDAPNGEYYYALIWNIRNDVEYTIKDDILDTIVRADSKDIKLRDLAPETGIMRFGNVERTNSYRNKNTDFLYRK